MLKPTLVTAPAQLPITPEEAWRQIKHDEPEDGEDLLMKTYMDAAVSYLDGYSGILGRGLITQTWKEQWDGFGNCHRLSLAPVQSITSVKYYDVANALQTVSSSVYGLFTDEDGAFVEVLQNNTWPSTYTRRDAVEINYVVGYGDDPVDVPAALRHAILLACAQWFEAREPVGNSNHVKLPLAFWSLIAPFRRRKF